MTNPSNYKKKCQRNRRRDRRPTISSGGSPSSLMSNWPLNTRVMQMVKTPHNVVNHSYVDYSLVPHGPDEKTAPTNIDDMDFHQKLYDMLGRSDLQGIIGWLPHGRAFRVNVPSKFEKTVCQAYFGHKRYSSFLYQLGVHGYKQISTGVDRGAYYSPLLLRGLPHLTKYMPNAKEFRHLVQDPENEPDFYLIRLLAPLPGDDNYEKKLKIDDILAFCREHGRSEFDVIQRIKMAGSG